MARIAIVHSFYDESVPSGENAAVLAQAELLGRSGHEVQLISQRTSDFEMTGLYAAKAAARTITGRGMNPTALLKDFGPDIIHVHNTFPNWSTNWMRQWGPKLVITLHNFRSMCSNALLFRDGAPCYDCLKTPIVPALRHRCYSDSATKTLPLSIANSPWGPLRKAVNDAAAIVALNDSAKRLYDSVFRVPATVIPNFVEDVPSPGPPVPTDGWLAVGRLTPEKGMLQLIKDWPGVEPLDIYGDGPQRNELEQAAAQKPGVTYRGAVDRDSLRRVMPRYVGLVIPSQCSEGLPTVALEAFAAGLPAVVSGQVSTANSMAAAGAASIYSPGDPKGLTSALAALSDPTHGRKARSLYEQSYHPDAWSAAMDDLYGRVISGDTTFARER